MQTAAASFTLPTIPGVAQAASASAAADGSSAGSGIASFAALLLSQMASGLLPVDPALAEAAADGENRAATETDPILLLAAMGLNLQPEATVDSADPETATDGGDMLPADARLARLTGDNTAAKPETTLADALKAAGRKTDDDTPRGTALPQAAGAAAGSAAAATANFAGFEQKLADSLQLQGNGEGTTQPTTGLATAQTTTHRPTAEVQQQHIASPLRSQAWPAEFSQKIVWMATQDKQSAQLTLNPSQMGPIEISLSIRNDQATAVFASGNAEVREVIEAALPRLREMLAGAGIELGQTNVSAESFRQAQEQANDRKGDGKGQNLADGGSDGQGRIGAGEHGSSSAVQAGDGLVDIFA